MSDPISNPNSFSNDDIDGNESISQRTRSKVNPSNNSNKKSQTNTPNNSRNKKSQVNPPKNSRNKKTQANQRERIANKDKKETKEDNFNDCDIDDNIFKYFDSQKPGNNPSTSNVNKKKRSKSPSKNKPRKSPSKKKSSRRSPGKSRRKNPPPPPPPQGPLPAKITNLYWYIYALCFIVPAVIIFFFVNYKFSWRFNHLVVDRNWASIASGAKVLSTFDTVFCPPSCDTILGIFPYQCYENKPEHLMDRYSSSWCFEGNKGAVQIKLGAAVYIRRIELIFFYDEKLKGQIGMIPQTFNFQALNKMTPDTPILNKTFNFMFVPKMVMKNQILRQQFPIEHTNKLVDSVIYKFLTNKGEDYTIVTSVLVWGHLPPRKYY